MMEATRFPYTCKRFGSIGCALRNGPGTPPRLQYFSSAESSPFGSRASPLCSEMATQIGGYPTASTLFGRACDAVNHRKPKDKVQIRLSLRFNGTGNLDEARVTKFLIQCSEKQTQNVLRTCRNCKTQFDPLLNHPRACRYHTAHFGGETKRKFESVYTGGTMNTPDSGKVLEYWHCCGSEDPFDPGCTAAPHASYDD